MLLIVLIGAALTNTFGRMVGNERQGWSLLGAMAVLFAVGLSVIYPAETSSNLHFATLGIDQSASLLQEGGNMEGKEVRFGIAGSALFANVTTDTSDGAVKAMHDSFTPLGGGMLMANIMMDEVIIGAPGSGLFSEFRIVLLYPVYFTAVSSLSNLYAAMGTLSALSRAQAKGSRRRRTTILKRKAIWHRSILSTLTNLASLPCDHCRGHLSFSSAGIAAATGSCGIRPGYVVVSLSTVPKRSASRC
jgi:hypothetical protein